MSEGILEEWHRQQLDDQNFEPPYDDNPFESTPVTKKDADSYSASILRYEERCAKHRTSNT